MTETGKGRNNEKRKIKTHPSNIQTSSMLGDIIKITSKIIPNITDHQLISVTNKTHILRKSVLFGTKKHDKLHNLGKHQT